MKKTEIMNVTIKLEKKRINQTPESNLNLHLPAEGKPERSSRVGATELGKYKNATDDMT